MVSEMMSVSLLMSPRNPELTFIARIGILIIRLITGNHCFSLSPRVPMVYSVFRLLLVVLEYLCRGLVGITEL